MMPSKHGGRRVVARINPISGAVALAMGSVVLASGPVHGADKAFMEEMVVTATRRSATVQDIPLNISAFSGEQLEKQQIDNLAEFARWVPGLTLVDQGPRDGSPMIIRGLNVSDLSSSETTVGNGTGDTVATYYGEIPIYIDLELIDVERIEVLRGPQGTLFGANSLAGAVRYLPRQPDTQEFSADIHARTYSISESDDLSYNADFVFNVPIINDKLALRGLLGYHDRKGFIDYDFLVNQPGVSNPQPDFTDPADVSANLHQDKDANDVTTTSFRLALLWDISDSVDATLGYYLQDREIGGRQINSQESMAAAPLGLATGEYISAMRVPEPSDRKNQIFSLDIVADFSFAELTSATGYTMYDQNGSRDQSDLLLAFGYPYSDFPSFTAFTREQDDTQILTQEVRLVSEADSRLNWIGGAFYYDADTTTASTEFTPGLANCTNCDPAGFFPPSVNLTDDVEYFEGQIQKRTELAVFGEVGYQFTDKFQATVGGRYFDVEDNFTVSIAQPMVDILYNGLPDGMPVSAYTNTTNATQSIDDFIFKFNTSYDFTDTVLGYITVSEGYRRGGSNGIEDCAGAGGGNFVCGTQDELLYDPDTTVNYEVGYKSAWFDSLLTWNISLFYIDWKNIQVADRSTGGGLPITINGNDAKSQGIETDIQTQIGDHWLLRSAYSYTNAELTQDAPQLVDGTAQSGDRLPGSPEHQGSVIVTYMHQVGGSLDINVDYGITAQSDVYTKVGTGDACCRDFGEALPGFALSHAAVSVAGDRWEARLYSDNLFDRYAETGVRLDQSLLGSAGPSQDFQRRNYFKYMATPRTIGIDFRYKIK